MADLGINVGDSVGTSEICFGVCPLAFTVLNEVGVSEACFEELPLGADVADIMTVAESATCLPASLKLEFFVPLVVDFAPQVAVVLEEDFTP